MRVRNVTADRGDAGRRLDLVLSRHLADVATATRTRIQQWIRAGQVTVDGTITERVADRVAAGAEIIVVLRDTHERNAPTAEEIDLEVLHEDFALLVVNKRPGMVVHPTYKHSAGTLINALLWRAQSWPAGQRPSIVGRLDKLTSGLVVVAKTRVIHATLQRAFAAGEKEYLAVVYGAVKPRVDTIEFRLARDPQDRRRVKASLAVGVPSVTRVERLASVHPTPHSLSLLRCRLVTGRMHQIRVHLKARGWPVVGDPTYGEPRWRDVADRVLAEALRAFPRQALHAWRARFRHPVGGRFICVEAPIPDDMATLLATCGFDKPL